MTPRTPHIFTVTAAGSAGVLTGALLATATTFSPTRIAAFAVATAVVVFTVLYVAIESLRDAHRSVDTLTKAVQR